MNYVMSLDHDQINTLVSALLTRIRDMEADATYRERTIDGLNSTISALRTEKRELLAQLAEANAEPADDEGGALNG